MSLMCAYQNCLCVKYPCSRIAFFRLPSDDRRSAWIKNSGNKSLINISAKAIRFFCENHFRQCDIRCQFSRKILRKHAVPIEHPSSCITPESEPNRPISNPEDGDEEDELQDTNLVIENLEDDPSTTTFYEDVEPAESEIGSNESPTEQERQLEDTYTLLDFDLPTDNSQELSEQLLEITCKEDKLLHDALVFDYETSSNQVDSSTFVIQPDVFEVQPDEEAGKPLDDLQMEDEVPMKKRKPNEVENNPNAQVSTSNNDYEEDKHFALSLVGYFQRMPKGKKSLAKLKILQYLTELDIGYSVKL